MRRLLGIRYKRLFLVSDFPVVTCEERRRLHEWLYQVDLTFGKLSASRGLGRIFENETVSLWELERCSLMLRCAQEKRPPIYGINDGDLDLCRRTAPPINGALENASRFITQLESRDRMIAEQDLFARQLAITKWNAIASFGSAIAALAAAAIAFFQLGGK